MTGFEFSWAWLWFVVAVITAVMFALERSAHNDNCAAFGASYSALVARTKPTLVAKTNPFRMALSEVLLRCAENGIFTSDIMKKHGLTLEDS